MAPLLDRAPLAALRARYDEPWRHYHVWAHVEAMLRHLDTAASTGVRIVDREAAEGFVLWHDAIYDPQAAGGRNERLSAELCRAEMASIAPPLALDRAVRAILATIDHRVPDGDCPDAALLLDIDLSVLGGDEDTFAAYDAAIRCEYAHVPDAAYRAGRRAILQRFLARDRLFLTEWAWARWEERARRNLTVTIGRLG